MLPDRADTSGTTAVDSALTPREIPGRPVAGSDGNASGSTARAPGQAAVAGAATDTGKGAGLPTQNSAGLTGKTDSLTMQEGDDGWPDQAPLSSFDSVNSARLTQGPVATQTGATDVARGASWQMSSAFQASGEKSFELLLDPAELGKVRIRLQTDDARMTINIQADRPETLALLRRHVDILAQDFRDMGYDSASFSFGPDAQDNGAHNPHTAEDAAPDLAVTDNQGADTDARNETHEPAAPTPGPGRGSGRLDIRL